MPVPDIRTARGGDIEACMALAEAMTEARSARALVRVALDRRELLVAYANGEVVGVLLYRTTRRIRQIVGRLAYRAYALPAHLFALTDSSSAP